MKFEYGKKELGHLRRVDKVLGAAIDKIGMIHREVHSDNFNALVSSIISQQISSKAADSVESRLCEKFSPLSPEKILSAEIGEIQKCGMSFRKAGYIKGIAEAVQSGDVDFRAFAQMTDDEIIKKLSSLNGIGVWTAEMFLIFSLCRPDVVSWGDLAIRRGMMNIYGLDDITKEQFNEYRSKYSPFGTVASLYIWAMSC